MELKSLALKTDLIFNKYNGELIDRGEYLVVKTDSNPNFFWGNYLVFPKAPHVGDFKKWTEIFKKEFTHPAIYHVTIAWDNLDIGDVSEFEQNGFKFEKSIALSMNKDQLTLPPKYNTEIQVRALKTDEEWESATLCHISAGMEGMSFEKRESFYRKQMGTYKQMVDQKLGYWFGAFLGNTVVSTCGLFKEGKLGRYQIVSTHSDFRRKGYCGSMVYETAKFAFDKMGLDVLVMVADDDYHAARIYEAVGFRPTEKMYGVSYWK